LKGKELNALDMCSGQGGFVKLLKSLEYRVTFMDSDGLITNSLIDRDNVIAFPFTRIPTNISDTIPFARNLCADDFNLVVSDGYSPSSTEKKEEFEYSSVHLWNNNVEFTTCQLIVANKLTAIGGSTVIKILGTPLYQDSGSLIFDEIAATYERFVVVKPSGSCPSSFEFYVAFINKKKKVGPLAVGDSKCSFYCKLTSLISVFAAQRRRLLNNAMGVLVAKQVGKAGADKPDPFPYHVGDGALNVEEEKLGKIGPRNDITMTAKHWDAIFEAVNAYEIKSGIREKDKERQALKMNAAPGSVPGKEYWLDKIDTSNSKSFLAHICQCAGEAQPVYLGWAGLEVSKKAIALVTIMGVVYEASSPVSSPRKVVAQSTAALALIRKLIGAGVIPHSYFIRFFG